MTVSKISRLIDHLDGVSEAIRGDYSGIKECTQDISNKTKALVMLSGGIDSTTLLYLFKHLGAQIEGLEFFYDGRPEHEIDLISKITEEAGVSYSKVNYPKIIGADGKKISLRERNSFYYSVASSFAFDRGIDYIVAGQILDDWCGSGLGEGSPEYYRLLNEILNYEYGKNTPKVVVPFLFINKKQVVEIGRELGVDFRKTRSCTSSDQEECGECEQCINRKEAFGL